MIKKLKRRDLKHDIDHQTRLHLRAHRHRVTSLHFRSAAIYAFRGDCDWDYDLSVMNAIASDDYTFGQACTDDLMEEMC
jgi:hypothetical protein